LPSGEEITLTPEEIKKYLNADGLRQVSRHWRNIFNLKVNKDCDYFSKSTLFKYSSDVHNWGDHELFEVRTFPDNGAKAGYAGIHIDGGEFGYIHNHDDPELWPNAVTKKSAGTIANRLSIGVTRADHDKDHDIISEATMLFDSEDGRMYGLTSDELWYVNNERRKDRERTSEDGRIPLRGIPRFVDVPVKHSDLRNDHDFLTDWKHHHTDNNFTHADRYLLNNLDDRTFVYPEISKSKPDSTTGVADYIVNKFMGLDGEYDWAEGDKAPHNVNRQSDLFGNASDRQGNAVNSYNANKSLSDITKKNGFIPGVFRSLEELEKVDLVGQHKTEPNVGITPLYKRTEFFYKWDGIYNHHFYGKDVNDNYKFDESFTKENLDPKNQDHRTPAHAEPTPYNDVGQTATTFKISDLFQWRYNRITPRWHSVDIVITVDVHNPGRDYHVGDLLRYNYLNYILTYQVDEIDSLGAILKGHNIPISPTHFFATDPGTNGVPIYFSNYTSTGKHAKFSIFCNPRLHFEADQIRNNLYAYVDVVPTIRSNSSTFYSPKPGDIEPKNVFTSNEFLDDTDYLPDDKSRRLNSVSTAPAPAYSGWNKGRGVQPPTFKEEKESPRYFSPLVEHGGNATAGPHVHLFRYILNGDFVTHDGVKVYTGKWVDQGPLGLERPADIKALLFSNPDCNNFNNYYKFMIDIFFDNLYRSPDAVTTGTYVNNPAPTFTAALCRIHIDQMDPAPQQRVYEQAMGKSSPDTMTDRKSSGAQLLDSNDLTWVDVTDKTLWINGGTRVMWYFSTSGKRDDKYGYGTEEVDLTVTYTDGGVDLSKGKWVPIAGTQTR
jgi:hypothetical protein